MSSFFTAEESKNLRIAAMGPELGPLYDAMWQQLAWLHNKWEQYVELYGTAETRLTILNEAAPMFFRVVQDTLWDDVLLHIARLTDSPQSMKKPNLSIRRFPGEIDHVPTKVHVQALVDDALTASEFCRDWRNRHIAHKDLALALNRAAIPLKPASRAKVKVAIQALDAVLNGVEHHYLESETGFDMQGTAEGAMSLLYVLNEGIRAEKARKARQKAGKTLPGDWDRTSL
jgi:hypothetical protein